MTAVDLFSPFGFEFFRNGLVIAALTGALCGLVGVFVVLRGMSYIGHGLSHAVFGGAALAAVLGVNFFIGAGFWGLTSGLMIGRVSRRRIIGADAAIGVITTASFAMGLALQARFGQAQRSIDAVLFGNYKTLVKKDDVGFNKTSNRGISTGERLLYTNERPAYMAKNRYSLPDHIPMAWDEFEAAIN